MRHRSHEDEAGKPIRMGERKCGCNRPAKRVSEQNESLETDAIERLGDQRRLSRRRSVRGTSGPIAPAVSRTIDQSDAAVGGEPAAEGEMHILKIAARPVHQDHRPAVQHARGTEFQHMQPAARDLDEAARRRMGGLDPRGPDGGDRRSHRGGRGDTKEKNDGHADAQGKSISRRVLSGSALKLES